MSCIFRPMRVGENCQAIGEHCQAVRVLHLSAALLALALDVNMHLPDHDDGTKSTLIYTEAPLIAGVLLGFFCFCK